MIGTVALIVLSGMLVLAALLRLPRWTNPRSRPMTVTVAALGAALILRSPNPGDSTIDRWLFGATGMANIPDLLGHLLTLVAAAAVCSHVASACGLSRTAIRSAHVLEACACLVMIAIWVHRGAETPVTNMVNLPGMGGYSAVFSAALAAPQLLMIVAVHRAIMRGCAEHVLLNLLRAAAIFGAMFSAHRFAVLAFPVLARFHYSVVTWALAAPCIALYGASAVANVALRRTY